MTKIYLLLTYLVTIAGVLPSQEDGQAKIAINVVNSLNTKQYEAVHSTFGASLGKKLSVEMVRDGWEALLGQNGSFNKILTTTKTNVEGNPLVKVRCKFDKANANVELKFDDRNQVIAFFLKP